MLRKLLKQDIRATWREFALLFLAILLAGLILPALIMVTESELLMILTSLLIFAIMIAAMVISIACLFRLFNRNIYSNEGYLSMTLPVSTNKLVLSKLLTGTGWITLTTIVGLACLFLSMTIYIVPDMNVTWNDLAYFASQILQDHRTPGAILCMFLIFLYCVISLAHGIIQLFFCCSLAHLRSLKGFRIPAAVVVFFLISWLEAKAFVIIAHISDQSGLSSSLNEMMMNLTYNSHEFTAINLSLLLIMLLTLIPIVLLHLGTVWMVKHRLELQ